MRKYRQYICLDCMSFWFVDELNCTRIADTAPDLHPDDKATIPIPICPKCSGNVYYCGSHKDRGTYKLFGERIAHLEYKEIKC